ncbi:MFS transporter [uncultured Tateyamaria sp.]|uniref:MFS transporter n=1 Tax=Tateyamaria sp. 1078 TaxID=3417464 RepID=UPI002633C420|nr:MFS transporter [uncultured Tateyamaria sp.]
MSIVSSLPEHEHDRDRLPFTLRRLILLQAVMNTCQFIALPFLALGLSTIPDIGLAGAGVAIGTYLGVGRISPLLLGPLADRVGLWRMVCTGLAVRGACLLLVPLISNTSGAIGVAIFLGLGVAAYETGIYGVMAAQPAKYREHLLMANVQALNVGCMVGPVIGFAAVMVSFQLAFIIPAVVFVSLSLTCVLNHHTEYRCASEGTVTANIMRVLKDRQFLWMCLALVPFWALFAQLFGALPVLMARATDSDAMAGTVIFLNGFVGFCAVPLYAYLAKRLSALALSAVGCGLGAVATWFLGPWAGAAFLVLLISLFSIAETFVTTAADVTTSRFADGKSTGSYFSVLNVSIGLGSAIGAPLGMMAISGDGQVSFALVGMAGIVSLFMLLLGGKPTTAHARNVLEK